MLNVKNNRELKGDNKIAAGLNFRQFIIAIICGIIAIIIFFNVPLPMEYQMAIVLCVAMVGWYFGWHTSGGLHGEDLLLIRLKNLNENNINRKYVTINKYIDLLNKEYMKKHNAQMKNKPYKKEYLKKEKARKKKKSQIHLLY